MKINAEAGLNRIMFLIVNRLMHLDTCRHEQIAIIQQKKPGQLQCPGMNARSVFRRFPGRASCGSGEITPCLPGFSEYLKSPSC